MNWEEKRIRAEVIREYLAARGEKKVVCLTCGNAAQALRNAGLEVVEVGGSGPLAPTRWLSYTEVAALWDCFDATSGHLPWPLMVEISKRLPDLEGEIRLPTGSGETLVCLKLRNPGLKIEAIFNLGPETEEHPEAPLMPLVYLLASGYRDAKSTKSDISL